MTAEKPLVSIIIPTYNRAHLIGETLDSVLAQTYQNWECIVVDDWSTDNTDDVLAGYMAKDARFQYHHRPKGRLQGGNAARNYGFELSKGDYIAFLDSDDLFHKMALSIKIGLISVYKSDVVISQHTILLTELRIDEKRSPIIIENSTFDIGFILSRNTIITSDPLINRQLLETVRFDEHLKRFQDHEFFIRLFRQNLNLCLIQDKLYFHRPNNNSISAQTIAADKVMIDAQVAIHKQMTLFYQNERLVIMEYRRKARKMYKGLVKNGHIRRVLENFKFFKNNFNHTYIVFTLFFLANIIFKRGFDRMK
ncbi:glycosyltransferase family 2 protein [Aequorivita sublithincola]|uniref:glycosyltransferase family 2 protein n=1 Tax=Aequorivita sublithincola TaxID=101385 RepID=UPI00145CA2B7|nr:glycosyltransferase family 2 protein [Aequorivita sublithincola]